MPVVEELTVNSSNEALSHAKRKDDKKTKTNARDG